MAKNKKTKKALSAYNLHAQREMKAGKTMKQAAASWKSGGKSSKTKSKSKGSKSKSLSKGGKKRMGKGGFNTQKLFKWVRIGALVLPAAQTILGPLPVAQKINWLKNDYFGIDANGVFHLNQLARGWLPYAAASVITYGIPKLISILRGR